MIFTKPELAILKTESDVEQKFLYPLMIGEAPSGLSYDRAEIQTKANIRKLPIGKGDKQKLYFPDYIVTRGGLPLLVAEAKAPGMDLDEAFREARLYAAELNSLFPSGIQPASRIIATDGTRLYAGAYDQAKPQIVLDHASIEVYHSDFAALVRVFGREALEVAFSQILPSVRPKRFWKPRKQVGGVAFQREEIGMNSFGATLSADFSHIFNPISLADRTFIAKNGYISSKRRERYIDPIDKVIRASTPPSEARSKTLDDTTQPTEIIKVLRSDRSLERQVLLIVGSAGAGKTSFVDHLREVALPTDIKKKTVWLHLNMNTAPISRQEIYDWLRSELISQCKDSDTSIDYDDLDAIKSVHAVEVNQFRKGVGRLYEGDQNTYNIKLADHIQSILTNKHTVAQNHAAYCSTNRGKLLVIVLDNCDKRLRDEQLLMFEAAQWIQKEFRALVVLPIREETYDNHQDEAPLDTALKDLVFRIEPPLFHKILQSRVQLAMRSVKAGGKKMLRYELPNGMHVDYPSSDQSHYLSSILRSVFEHDMHVRRLIVGLAGRNMRRAMEIFLEFCTSGHIEEDHILKMVQSEGQYVLPLSLVTTVLLRTNLRFYDSDRAYLKNLYAASELDQRPSFFARLLILKLLDEKSNIFGPQRLKGYVHVSQIRSELSRYGVEQQVFFRELEALARGFCVLSEDFRTTELTDDDLVALAPAGRVHLQICTDVYYLAAVAEDTWFEDLASADAIALRIKDGGQQYLPRTVLYNAKAGVEALRKAREKDAKAYDAVFGDRRFDDLTGLDQASNAVNAFERSIVSGPWSTAEARFPAGTEHTGKVANKTKFGIFIDLQPGVTGLVHSSSIKGGVAARSDIEVGSKLRVMVINLDSVGKRMNLVLTDTHKG
ncbi:S1 RNA-binding domain-containing protein [Mesorhizobium sp. B2-3-13]|uniref:type I restriction enzyme HsdR N-terminal domain-containing protein n=1 Tax=Mesorhizobium sp. B2-3-13 TaxID=2589951 RepID=UPI0011286EE1|nr:type I restriction enzyme HsdR N-terminal domain-containing protein [Mesorhizobium sp. B2-3-13]TPL86428.1 S1 RNA-binding domain-containing protein [Mesorhizobium sp. B2-3-13]